LAVRGLSTRFETPNGMFSAVEGVDLDLRPGEVLGLVGESGSGKSMTLRSIVRLVPKPGRISGEVYWRGRELIGLPEAQLRAIRGREIAMIFQEPMTALNPVLSVRQQIDENLKAHTRLAGRERLKRAVELLDLVGIPAASSRLDDYPHQFSGGMRQRVMIAIALASEPKLLLADEPTTALDVTIQDQILKLILELRERLGMSVILVTHDLGVVAQTCDRMAVMYAGRIVESGRVGDVLARPRHAYTLGLIGSMPQGGGERRPLRSIEGTPPSAGEAAPGCAFNPRCSFATAICRDERPPLVAAGDGREVACHHQDEVARQGSAVLDAETASASPAPTRPLLQAVGLTRHFRMRRTLVQRLFGKPAPVVHALNGVSLDLTRGETLGVVGESGCGKSTLARVLVRLIEADSGDIRFDGEDVRAMPRQALRRYNRRVQMIFQDPYGSLNPRMNVGQILGEALSVHRIRPRPEIPARIRELLGLVRLPVDAAARLPHEFSGGQRQRIGIARALAVEPECLIADELVSALDVSVQAQVVNLLLELQDRLHLTILFVAHDLRLVRHISHRVAVMYLGSIVEIGETERLFTAPKHPYTQALLAAAPDMNPARRSRVAAARGDLPSPLALPSGCPFHPRCPHVFDRCLVERPPLMPRPGDVFSACHIADPKPVAGFARQRQRHA
jgi:peptide/nickel transport system ATP-binding protein